MDKYDVIIVGSGAAGGTLVLELSLLRPDLKILLIEKGGMVKSGEEGKFWPFFLKYYRRFVLGSRSKEGVVIYAGEMLGGTTVISCGNMVRSEELECRFSELGVDLSPWVDKAHKLIGVESLSDTKINLGGTWDILQAAQRLGIDMRMMPKAIKYYCKSCGNCVKGCRYHAKWDTRSSIGEAVRNGNTRLEVNKKVEEVISINGGYGVKLVTGEEIESRIVVLAAGALNTPKILQRSGINAGKGLFIHPFEVVYGRVDYNTNQHHQPTMATYYKPKDGILLSPFIDESSQIPFACGIKWWFKNPIEKLLGIMVKVADPESEGVVEVGSIHYEVPWKAQMRMEIGTEIAAEILKEAGAKKIKVTPDFPRGAHPQGTARIGEVVNKDLRLFGADGIYVSDASVIPLATGTPPILTLVALNMRLAQHLKEVI